MSVATTTRKLGTNSEEWYKALYEDGIAVTPENLGLALDTIGRCINSPQLKENLLLFVQNSAQILSDEPATMEHVFKTLRNLVYNPQEPASVRSQALITQTALSIELESLHTPAPQLEDLVGVLLELCAYRPGVERAGQEKPKIALPTTVSEQRLLRSTACRCLQELEEAYPGLMCSSLSSLVEWLQLENSYVLQDLVSLAAAVLLHGVAQLIAQRSAAAAAGEGEGGSENGNGNASNDDGNTEDADTGPSSFQSSLSWRPSSITAAAAAAAAAGLSRGGTVFGLEKELVDVLQKEVLSAVGNLYNTIVDLSDWGVLRLVSLLAPLTLAGLVPATTLLPHCTRFAHSSSPLLLFLATDLTGASPSMKMLTEDVISGLLGVAENPSLGVHWRVLSVAWLGSLASAPALWEASPGHVAPQGVLRRIAQGLAPSYGGEPLDVREARLCSLVHCFRNAPPSGLCETLVCMKEFRAYKAGDMPALQFFNVIEHWLASYPVLVEPLFIGVAMKEAVQDSGYVPNLLHLVDALPEAVSERLLGAFEGLLPEIPPQYLPSFLPLVERVAATESADPGPVLDALKGLLTRTALCASEAWGVGSDVLAVCRETLLHHKLADILGPLGDVLAYIADNYADLEIRDRAAFYLELVTHVPAHSIRAILTEQASSDPTLFSTQARETQESSAIDLISETFIPAGATFIELSRHTTDPTAQFPAAPLLTRTGTADEGDQKETTHKKDKKEENEEIKKNEQDSEKDPLDTYLRALKSCEVSIQLQTRLHFKGGKAAAAAAPASTLYDISVSLEQRPPSGLPFYSAGKVITAPYLKALPQATGDSVPVGAEDSFPYCYDDTIVVTPSVPLPGSLVPFATFNDATGKIYTSELDPISIHIEDLFLPFQSQDLVGAAPDVVFPLLWDYLGALLKEPDTTQDPLAVQVVKLLHAPLQEIATESAQRMGHFVVKNGTSDERNEVNVGVLLPPHFHLLIKIVPHEHETCLAHIRTDFWYILAYIDSLVDTMFT